MPATSPQQPRQTRRVDDEYVIVIQGIPPQYRWQELKDLVRQTAVHIKQAVVYDDDQGVPTGLGQIIIKDQEEAWRTFNNLTTNGWMGQSLNVSLSIAGNPLRRIAGPTRSPVRSGFASPGAMMYQPAMGGTQQISPPMSPDMTNRAFNQPRPFPSSNAVHGGSSGTSLLAAQLQTLSMQEAGIQVHTYSNVYVHHQPPPSPLSVATVSNDPFCSPSVTPPNGTQAGATPTLQRGTSLKERLPTLELDKIKDFRPASKVASRHIVIKNISRATSPRDLRTLLLTAGQIETFQLSQPQVRPTWRKATQNRNPLTAWTTFRESDSATAAIQRFNGFTFMRAELEVGYDASKAPKPAVADSTSSHSSAASTTSESSSRSSSSSHCGEDDPSKAASQPCSPTKFSPSQHHQYTNSSPSRQSAPRQQQQPAFNQQQQRRRQFRSRPPMTSKGSSQSTVKAKDGGKSGEISKKSSAEKGPLIVNGANAKSQK